jgi:hypothetical protein
MSDGDMSQLLAGFSKLKPKAGIALAELADASQRVAEATGIVAPSTDAPSSIEPPTTTARSRSAVSERGGGRSAKEASAKAMKVLRVKLPADLYKEIRVKAALDETSIGELAEKAWRAFLST